MWLRRGKSWPESAFDIIAYAQERVAGAAPTSWPYCFAACSVWLESRTRFPADRCYGRDGLVTRAIECANSELTGDRRSTQKAPSGAGEKHRLNARAACSVRSPRRSTSLDAELSTWSWGVLQRFRETFRATKRGRKVRRPWLRRHMDLIEHRFSETPPQPGDAELIDALRTLRAIACSP